MKTRSTAKRSGVEPTGKARRAVRRDRQRREDQVKEERNRSRAMGGGQANELGVTQGQNAEQGNTVDPHNARPLGKPSH